MNKEENIIRKSFIVFLYRGYNATSFVELSAETGMSKGTFYYYFRDKKDLLKAGLDKYTDCYKSVVEKERQITANSLREYINLILNFKEECIIHSNDMFGKCVFDSYYLKLVCEVGYILPAYRKFAADTLSIRHNDWKEKIEAAQKNGEVKSDLDASTLAYSFFSIFINTLDLSGEPISQEAIFLKMRMQFEQYYELIKA